MSIDWRNLLTDVGIPWRDRGRNCSRGNVNVCCPFCGDDDSFHLAIAETDEPAYYCRRDGSHSGRNAVYLLAHLGVERKRAVALLNAHGDGTAVARVLPQGDATQWQRFRPAHEYAPALRFLEQRGFVLADETAKQFDLRCAPFGSWSHRLLLPLTRTAGDTPISWVGRAFRNSVTPKYLSHECAEYPGLFAGRFCADQRALIVVEGPLDALKINAALVRMSRNRYVSAVALLGKALTPPRLLTLVEHTRLQNIWLCLDNDASVGLTLRMRSELEKACRGALVHRLRLPSAYKDAGEMPILHIIDWLVCDEVVSDAAA